jgi:hypothetical protein
MIWGSDLPGGPRRDYCVYVFIIALNNHTVSPLWVVSVHTMMEDSTHNPMIWGSDLPGGTGRDYCVNIALNNHTVSPPFEPDTSKVRTMDRVSSHLSLNSKLPSQVIK